MNILICTILRDNEFSLPFYFSQLEKIVKLCPQHDFYLSIFENDSRDNTKQILINYKYKDYFKKYFLSTIDFGYPKFLSEAREDRVKLLAFYRNSAMEQVENLDIFNKIVWIESDIFYNPEDVIKLFNSDYDVYSGTSLRCNFDDLKSFDFNCDRWLKNLYSKPYHYWLHCCRDGWATRIKAEHLVDPIPLEEWLNYFDNENDIPFYSTFNSFAVYNAKPIQQGVRFGYINKKYNRFDCDTYVICEKFQDLGFNKIYLNNKIKILHIEACT